MKTTLMYECDMCGRLFQHHDDCAKHERLHSDQMLANELFLRGYTLGYINDKYHLWKLPEYLVKLKKNSTIVCDTPVKPVCYKAQYITARDGFVEDLCLLLTCDGMEPKEITPSLIKIKGGAFYTE